MEDTINRSNRQAPRHRLVHAISHPIERLLSSLRSALAANPSAHARDELLRCIALAQVWADDEGEIIPWWPCDQVEPRSEFGDADPPPQATIARGEQGEGERFALGERVAIGGATAPQA